MKKSYAFFFSNAKNSSEHTAHILGLTDSSKTSDTTSNYENFCWRYFTGSSDLTSEKSAKMIGGFHHSTIT